MPDKDEARSAGEPVMDATMALEIKRAVVEMPVPFKQWRRAGEIDMALEAIIQGRHIVVEKPRDV